MRTPVLPAWLAGTRPSAVIVLLAAVAASAGSISNGFALDDVHIIQGNERIHSLGNLRALFSETYWPPEYGQSLYRPLTLAAFTVQWVVGDGSPVVFHAVSIALYAAVCLALLHLARQFMGDRPALIGATIFAVHPLHVEAFANIVGQSELWVGLITFWGTSSYLKIRRAGGPGAGDVLGLSAMYFAALMFKEHAIVFPAFLVAAELTLVGETTATRRKLVRLGPFFASLFAVAFAFVAIRTSVIGRFTGAGTTHLAGEGFGTRFYTLLSVVPEWVRLFFWPENLSAEYSSPRVEPVSSFDPGMLPGLLIIAAVAGIAWHTRHDRPAVSFSLALAGIALLIPSNLIVVTGFLMAERALFLGSAGAALACGFALAAALDHANSVAARRVLAAAAGVVLMLGTARSAARAQVWRDNETLFRQTVLDEPLSYRAHMRLGELLTDQGKLEDGLAELLMAVRLSRKEDFFVRWFVADRFHAAGRLNVARQLYNEAVALKPSDREARYGAAVCLTTMGLDDEARAMAAEGMRRDPDDERFARVVHMIDSLRSSGPPAHESTNSG